MAGSTGNILSSRGRTFAGDPNPMPQTPGKLYHDHAGKLIFKMGDGHRDYCCCGCQFLDVGHAGSEPYCSDLVPIFYTVAFAGVTSCGTCFDNTTPAGEASKALRGVYPKISVANLVPNITKGIARGSLPGWSDDETDQGCVGVNRLLFDRDADNLTCPPALPASQSSPGSGTYSEFLIFLSAQPTQWVLTVHESAGGGSMFYGTLARANQRCYQLQAPLVFTNQNTTCGAASTDGFGQYATGGTATITPCCSVAVGGMGAVFSPTDPSWYPDTDNDAAGI